MWMLDTLLKFPCTFQKRPLTQWNKTAKRDADIRDGNWLVFRLVALADLMCSTLMLLDLVGSMKFGIAYHPHERMRPGAGADIYSSSTLMGFATRLAGSGRASMSVQMEAL